MKRKVILIGIIGILLSSFSACKKDKDETHEFDKAALLTNLADNYIIPGYADLYTKVSNLKSAYTTFSTTPDATNLELVRTAWKNAYLVWEDVKMFDLGPAMTVGLKGAIGIFPSDTTQICSNISTGTYDLSSLANVGAIGFSALDYLLYQPNALTEFTTNSNYLNYGMDLITKMEAEVLQVKNGWNSYRATFIASTGNESTSAFSMLVNDFCHDYEVAKNAKVGIPIGKQSLGIQMPEYIEARFSGYSFALLRENVKALHAVYEGGYYNGTQGKGFDDYLIALEKTTLNSTINANFTSIINKVDSFSGTLETEMANNPSGLEELFQLIAGQVVYLKTDMTSSFGILITYQDNDGD
jgi:predicted lipoprotein